MSRIIRVPKRLLLLVVSLVFSVLIRVAGLAFGNTRETNHRPEPQISSGKQIALLVKRPRLQLFRRSKSAKPASCYSVQLATLQPFIRITPINSFATPSANGPSLPGLGEENSFDAMIMSINVPPSSCGSCGGCGSCGSCGDCGNDGGGDSGCTN